VSNLKVTDRALLENIARTFRRYGYEGASLSRISEATDLGRASLYHRFPDGKAQMALAVLDYVVELFGSEVLAPLFAEGVPARRVQKMATQLRRFYAEGHLACALDALSLETDSDELRARVQTGFRTWVEAMEGLAREAGLSPAKARRASEDAFLRIQGSLVLCRASGGDNKPFRRVLAELPDLLTTTPS
jgi:AcrR family transcriptional regulator